MVTYVRRPAAHTSTISSLMIVTELHALLLKLERRLESVLCHRTLLPDYSGPDETFRSTVTIYIYD